MTPTEERELLELAAKACGYDMELARRKIANLDWNSLHNSGDCFDLAAHLKLDIIHDVDGLAGNLCVEVRDHLGKYKSAFECFSGESERPAATRLAVTRAAAEIGRRMKG